MTELAGFLSQRDAVRWTLLRGDGGKVSLRASHPQTLSHQTWAFPQDYYSDARVVEGRAKVQIQDGMIFVVAGDGPQLRMEFTQRRDPARPKAETIEAKR
jgi:hypothetical protein